MNFLVSLLLFLLPFHAFLVTWSQKPLSAFWKEGVLLLILLYSIGKLSLDRRKLISLITDKLLWIILAYIAFASASLLWANSVSLGRFMHGFKYELMPFAVFLIAYVAAYSNEINFKKVLKWFYIGGSLSILFGLFIQYILGPENLVMFAYRGEWSTYTPGKALAFCHTIEETEVCRLQSTFAGPNQFAFYILIYLTLAFYYLQESFLNKSKYLFLHLSLVIIALFSLYLTYSRSAWLGLFGVIGSLMLINYKTIFQKKYWKQILLILLLLMAGIGILYLQMGDLFENIILRVNSTGEHMSKWKDGFTSFTMSPIWGQGLASSGPAARLVSETPLIPESWFLQVAINTGIIGFILFIVSYLGISWNLLGRKNEISKYLLALMLGLIIPMQVLHVFEDSSMTYSLFLILGIYLANKDNKSVL